MRVSALRIRSNEVRPLLRNRADCPIIILQQETPSIEVVISGSYSLPFGRHRALLPAATGVFGALMANTEVLTIYGPKEEVLKKITVTQLSMRSGGVWGAFRPDN